MANKANKAGIEGATRLPSVNKVTTGIPSCAPINPILANLSASFIVILLPVDQNTLKAAVCIRPPRTNVLRTLLGLRQLVRVKTRGGAFEELPGSG
eukprot:3333040-Heterocapsa_arctica.AAC.1